ncbi:TlpA family protein disulfide reductase [Flavobacterium soli]|uniref:TlpA family protein disulfide reductase n=1 Tax=Flavobacterium soli TaxID=344881 RepID=UPI000414B36F|nr:TlpA disulfide reductase family protein [Flavobacterium soli]
MKQLTILLLFVISVANAQKELPNLTLKGLDNKAINIKTDYAETDKLYVFSFWATWCGPCLNELEAISEEYDNWTKELNVELIAVSTDDARTQKRVKPLVNGKNWPFSVILDSNQDFKRSLAIVDIPYTIVVKNGIIVHIQSGYMQGSEKELFTILKTL